MSVSIDTRAFVSRRWLFSKVTPKQAFLVLSSVMDESLGLALC
jgi:hypothetical protein